MFNLVMGLMESDSSGGWGGSGGGCYPQPEPALEDDLIEVDITDPAREMERLCRRALTSLESGYEAALETEMLRQHLEACKLQGTALKPVLLQNIARVLSAAQLSPLKQRCPWAGEDPLYVEYHDREWGVPVKDDRKLFEFIILEGAQAGLSWITILRKRESFRQAFAGFDPVKVAAFTEKDVERLLQDPGIIRNRLKVQAAIKNARAFLEIDSFSDYLWGFVEGKPIINHWKALHEVPAVTPLAERISKDLKRRGFSFVGPTIVYAHMQATGMVNDHLVSCFRHSQLA